VLAVFGDFNGFRFLPNFRGTDKKNGHTTLCNNQWPPQSSRTAKAIDHAPIISGYLKSANGEEYGST
jgi:hypothetical protein